MERTGGGKGVPSLRVVRMRYRRRRILRMHRRGMLEGISISELSRQFACSRTTIRRDLREIGLDRDSCSHPGIPHMDTTGGCVAGTKIDSGG